MAVEGLILETASWFKSDTFSGPLILLTPNGNFDRGKGNARSCEKWF